MKLLQHASCLLFLLAGCSAGTFEPVASQRDSQADSDALVMEQYRALQLFQKGKVDEGLAVLDQLVQKVPNNAELLTPRGTIHRKSGNYEQSIGDFNQAIRFDTNYAGAFRLPAGRNRRLARTVAG